MSYGDDNSSSHQPPRRFHLVADSGGPGRWRGGHAVRLDLQVLRPEGQVTARGMERLRFQPWGGAGGKG